MLSILTTILPIFVIILIGYLAVATGYVSRNDIQSVGQFVFKIALPALVFKSLSQTPFAAIIKTDFLFAYALGCGLTFWSMFTFARYGRRYGLAVSAMHALGASGPNSGFIGFPIAVLVVGPSAGVALALAMIVENAILIPSALMIAEAGAHKGVEIRSMLRQSAVRLAQNPLIIAIVLGGIVSLAQVPLPTVLAKPLDLIGLVSAPAALFVVGGTLVNVEFRGIMTDVAWIVSGKLCLHPMFVGAALLLVPGLDPALKTSMVIFASVPMLSIYPLLGRRYGEERTCATALLAATIFSFATLSILLAFL